MVITVGMGAAMVAVVWAISPGLLGRFGGSRTLLEVTPSPAFACKARADELVKATYVVRNVTGREVNILGVRSSCTCATVGTEMPMKLAPGGEGRIELSVTVGDPGADGKFKKAVDLFVDSEGTVPPLKFEATVAGAAPPS